MGFAPSAMQLNSTAFGNNGSIPTKHTGVGEDISPGIGWPYASGRSRPAPLLLLDSGTGQRDESASWFKPLAATGRHRA